MPPSLGLLYLRALKLVGAAVSVFVFASFGPSVWADPPPAPQPSGAPSEAADAITLFRAVGRGAGPEAWDAVSAALEARFPLGSDASPLIGFLTADGLHRRGLANGAPPGLAPGHPIGAASATVRSRRSFSDLTADARGSGRLEWPSPPKPTP